MMTKNSALAAALLCLAVSIGCSSAHSPGIPVIVTVSDANNLVVLYPTQAVVFTAKVVGTSNTAVTWSLSQNGTDCTNNSAVCGTLSSTTGSPVTYTAPDQNNVPATVTVVATSQADSTKSDSLDLNINHISVQVTPKNAFVGVGLTQQYTAVVIPDDAPQTVTYSIQNCSGSCGSIGQATGLYNGSGATNNSTFSVQAAVDPNLDSSGFAQIGAEVVTSRLIGSATYAFRFSGFDTSGKATSFAGQFAVVSDGQTISSGVWDQVTSAGFYETSSLTGSYATSGSQNPDTNNHGTLTLKPTGAPKFTFEVVFDAAGDMQLIESDANGTSSGIIEPVTGAFGNASSLSGNFVFGFTGVNYATGARAGYVGLVAMDGSGHIGSGLLDTNQGGTAGSASDITGSYTMNNGIGTMTITSATLGTYNFNLYGVSGKSVRNNPAVLYAISTDSIGTNPGVSGSLVFQDPNLDPTNAGLKNAVAIIALTGADNGGSNVSLHLASFDGNGGVTGQFDQNDAGTILSVPASTGFSYTYTASQNGRYVVKLLGNPTANPAVAPLPFVLCESATATGFLLDQSSASVITGTIVPQRSPKGGYSNSDLPSTYAAATVSSGASGVDPTAANLLLTCGGNTCSGSQGNGTFNVSGTAYDVSGSLGSITGTFNVLSTGVGVPSASNPGGLMLTAPSKQNYVLYMIDDIQAGKTDVTHFLTFEADSTAKNASIINVQQ